MTDVLSPERSTAEDLLEIGAVILRPDEPFQWSSGLLAPIYCDNRLTMAYPPVRRRIADRLADTIEKEALVPDVIVGTATAGIPHAAWLAEHLDRPMAYVRGAAKKHGRQNAIEGRVQPEDRVVVVEDLISTGGSALGVVETLRAAGASVEAVLAIFSYGLETAARRFEQANVACLPLVTFETLLEVAGERNQLSPEAAATLQRWRKDPEEWSRAAKGRVEG